MLAAAQREGVLRLHAEPEAVAEILFSLADGFALRMLTEPERDFHATIGPASLRARAAGRLTPRRHRERVGRLGVAAAHSYNRRQCRSTSTGAPTADVRAQQAFSDDP